MQDNQNPAAQHVASDGASDAKAPMSPAAAGPLFPESILLKVSVAQKKKCQERGGHRGVNRWIKSLIDAA